MSPCYKSHRTETLERIKLSVSAALPRDWCHEVGTRQLASFTSLVVDVIAYGTEIVTEGEAREFPDSAWDAIKAKVNDWLGALDRWYVREGLRPFPWRLKVRTVSVRTRQVHHVCPHIGKDFYSHVMYLKVPKGREPGDHRLLERIRVVVSRAIEEDDRGGLYEIHHLIRDHDRCYPRPSS